MQARFCVCKVGAVLLHVVRHARAVVHEAACVIVPQLHDIILALGVECLGEPVPAIGPHPHACQRQRDLAGGFVGCRRIR